MMKLWLYFHIIAHNYKLSPDRIDYKRWFKEFTMSIITAQVETITPSIAKELLSMNDENRKVTPGNVIKIEKALEAGEWQVSGQTIIVSETGRLLDGQHRLHAVLNTGINMQHLVCRGISDTAFKVIDTGKGRTGGDALSILGVVKSNKIGNLIKLLIAYDNKHMTRLATLSNTELVNIYTQDPAKYDLLLEEGVQLSRIAYVRLFNEYTLAVLYAVFGKHDIGLEYLMKVLEASIDEKEEIIAQVKGKMLKLNKEASNRVTKEQMYYVLFAGYKHYVAGTTFTKSFATYDTRELKKISKSIPYLV